MAQMNLQSLLITRGRDGMVALIISISCGHSNLRFRSGGGCDGSWRYGDRVYCALAAGATTEEAAQLANYAGGIVVMKRGTATVSREELLHAIEQTPPATRPH
jgi:bifunctional ADP-heptose synthase (sugar kinase/adenylyltransferase)